MGRETKHGFQVLARTCDIVKLRPAHNVIFSFDRACRFNTRETPSLLRASQTKSTTVDLLGLIERNKSHYVQGLSRRASCLPDFVSIQKVLATCIKVAALASTL